MRSTILTLGLLLAGCATNPFSPPDSGDWQRENTTQDQAISDLQSCRRLAQSRFSQDAKIQQDMGVDQTSQGGLVSNLQQYQTEKRVDQIVHDCMLTLGYHTGDQTPASTPAQS